MVTPPYGGWDLPRVSVATWVTSHFAVVGIYAVVLVSGTPPARVWPAVLVALWLAGISGLCWRLLAHLAIGRSLPSPSSGSRMRGDLKLGLFVAGTYTSYLVVHQLGPAAVGGFLSVLALTTGLRVAGLDAWAGRIRSPWFYVRSVMTAPAIGAFALLVVAAGAVFVAAALLLDPLLRDAQAIVETILGSPLSRSDQFRTLVLGMVVLSPPVLATCEAIAATSRHEAALADRLSNQERRIEREGIARDIHDGVILSTLGEIRRLSTSDEQKRLINGLDLELRQLQLERLAVDDDRELRTSLRRPFQQANRLGLGVELDSAASTLGLVVAADVAIMVERLLLLQLANSAEAGATQATLRVVRSDRSDTLALTYHDDGGGFDPSVVDRRPGGLARLRSDLERQGGTLRFRQWGNRTLSRAVLPARVR